MEIRPFNSMTVNASYAIRRGNWSRYQRSTRIPYSIYPEQIDLMGNDYLNEYRTTSSYDAFNIYGEYRLFLDNHDFKAMVGFNQETYLAKSIDASKQNLVSDDLNSLGLGTDNPQADGGATEWALQGVFY
ncbi:hypothetical protein LZ575_14325 [Antarcticibacterium sp. 1MA-6-2]|uniref:hypothetical protein n=1 Tax=Antarcticibacterium sp. 1MA-6-2 TaxID=2908210 RepID=UPI001F28676B|nr:hypothetical protein [Antarcticibacterium sp. 1MA-6-2]UJH90087.1 hypothetical protein LZ575_14325 [Antarcticibacterium sp. 1MA-6-2]